MRRYHKLRKSIHVVCFVIFCALPFFNVMRFDIPRQRFYFVGQELWISEFAIIFFVLMFLLFVITAAAMLYGRVYCSYLCPQMIFSEASLTLEARLKKYLVKHFIQWPARRRALAAGAVFYLLLGLASVGLAFVFIAYFVEPRDLLQRLMRFDLVTAGGVSGAVTTLFTFLDFAFVRQHFCTTVCPYGYLQGMLADANTLLVTYRDGAAKEKVCIECKKCVRVCHMGIDIRKSAHQIECIHCGECIEACDEVLARLNKPGLIHYTWGEQGELLGNRQSWWRKLGFRDAKRALVLAVILAYAFGLAAALSMRRVVLVRISPDRTVLYSVTGDGLLANRFRLSLANRGRNQASVAVALEGLRDARLTLPQNPLPLQPDETRDVTFEVQMPPSAPAPGVNHFRFRTHALPEDSSDVYEMTFIAPQTKTP